MVLLLQLQYSTRLSGKFVPVEGKLRRREFKFWYTFTKLYKCHSVPQPFPILHAT